MNSKHSARSFFPLVVVFVVTTVLLIAVPSLEFLWGMDRSVMLAGNAILFVATLISFFLYRRSLENNRAAVFMRMIYAGTFAKMMICLFSALIYIMVARKGVSKGAVLGLMFLYFVYTFMEISIILKLSRKEKYAKDRGAA